MRHQGPWAAPLVAAVTLAACGGGGGAPQTERAATPVRSTALASTATTGPVDLGGFARPRALRSSDLVPDVSRFPDPDRTYVSLVAIDGSGGREPLVLLRLSALLSLDRAGGLSLALPRDVRRVQFEVYDSGGERTRVTGEISA